jgi:hypothetical protein
MLARPVAGTTWLMVAMLSTLPFGLSGRNVWPRSDTKSQGKRSVRIER